MEAMALTESTYYILLSLYHPQHGHGRGEGEMQSHRIR